MPSRFQHALAASVLIVLAYVAPPLARAENDSSYRMELTRCMSHIERASQATMMKQPWAEDARKALRCAPGNATGLSEQEQAQLATIYQLFDIQMEAPSATVHTQLILEIGDFLRLIR